MRVNVWAPRLVQEDKMTRVCIAIGHTRACLSTLFFWHEAQASWNWTSPKCLSELEYF